MAFVFDAELGRAGSRNRLNTPALVLDLDAFEINLQTLATFCKGAGIRLRPHAKTHKSSVIARRQIDIGAIGVCCATLDEAEVMSAKNLPGILITSPIVSAEKIARLAALFQQSPDLILVVDNYSNVEALDRAATVANQRWTALVDFDLGHHRTGVLETSDAVRLARLIATCPGLHFGGIQAYGGHLQHICDCTTRVKRARAAERSVADLVKALTDAALQPNIITGAGTGTYRIDGLSNQFTELQCGSYIFMDAEYMDIEFEPGAQCPFKPALFVQSSIISTNVPGKVTVDAGSKAFALNGKRPRVTAGPLVGARYEFSGDEHGCLIFSKGHVTPRIGERLEFVVSHCDPTVANYDVFYCVRGDVLVDIWPIDARARAIPQFVNIVR